MNPFKSIYRFLSPKYQTLFLEYKTEFKPRYGHGKPAHPILQSTINCSREEYKNLLLNFLRFTEVFHQIKAADEETRDDEPRWNNGYLPGLDVVALYSLVVPPNFFISEDEEFKKNLLPVWDHPNLQTIEWHGESFWFVKN